MLNEHTFTYDQCHISYVQIYDWGEIKIWGLCAHIYVNGRISSARSYVSVNPKVRSSNLELAGCVFCRSDFYKARGVDWRREALVGPGLDYPAVAIFFLTCQGESLSFPFFSLPRSSAIFTYAYQSSVEIGHAFSRRIDRQTLLY